MWVIFPKTLHPPSGFKSDVIACKAASVDAGSTGVGSSCDLGRLVQTRTGRQAQADGQA